MRAKNASSSGYVGALPGCLVGSGRPATQDYKPVSSRESIAVLPVDGNGNITVSVSGSGGPAINVDLLGWYGNGGLYHRLVVANPTTIHNPNLIHPGDVIRVPRA